MACPAVGGPLVRPKAPTASGQTAEWSTEPPGSPSALGRVEPGMAKSPHRDAPREPLRATAEPEPVAEGWPSATRAEPLSPQADAARAEQRRPQARCPAGWKRAIRAGPRE